jgi:hypothetical protein
MDAIDAGTVRSQRKVGYGVEADVTLTKKYVGKPACVVSSSAAEAWTGDDASPISCSWQWSEPNKITLRAAMYDPGHAVHGRDFVSAVFQYTLIGTPAD